MDFMVFILGIIIYFPLSVVKFLIRGRMEYLKYKGIILSMLLNRRFSNFFNKTLRTENGYEFGHENETTSCALGKNQILGTLTDKGEKVVKFLNKCEPFHCIKSVHDEVFEEKKKELMRESK